MPGTVGGVGSNGTVVSSGPEVATAAGAAASAPAAAPVVLASALFKADPDLAAVAHGDRTLGYGARGAGVKLVQQALKQLGQTIGTPDGALGRGTQAAIAGFQRGAGLTPSGVLDRETLHALDAKVAAATPVSTPPAPPPAVKLTSARFSADPHFAAIAAGSATLGAGAKGPDVQKLQLTLLGLGLDIPGGADSSFGNGTVAAVKSFQAQGGLPQSGKLDAATLGKLDAAASQKVAALRSAELAPRAKADKYHVVADLKHCRIYVLEKGTEKPVAAYLTSPGSSAFPTEGDHFTLQSATVMGAWTPPKSAWAANAQVVPPGLENPMGICKLSFGAYSEYFHGIPKAEEKALGTPASHGCCRMSGTNILDFHEKYAGPGTDVVLLRDPAQSDALAAKFAAAGVTDTPTAAGVEYTAAYLYGEMGRNEVLRKDGTIALGGRG